MQFTFVTLPNIYICNFNKTNHMHQSEILTHLGEDREKYFNSVAPPILQSSNFSFQNLDDFRNAFSDESKANIYTRGNNPTVKILREKLAALEGSEDCLVFASGCAAISSTILSHVHQGVHVVCVDAPYSWTQRLFADYLPKFGVEHTFVNGKDLEAIEAAIQPNTTLLYLESPNTATFELQNLKACGAIAKKHGILTAIDNSYSSPIFQRPIEHGIDIVIHSGSKYLNGHSDVVAGVVCSSSKIISQIFAAEYMNLGGIISPHDASLIIRGLRTLALRVHQSNKSGQKVVAFLENHPKIEKVLYPFSPSFPQYELAQQQMTGAGGLFSFLLKTNQLEKAEAFFNRLQCFLLAVSWGGHESLVLPYCGFYNVPGKPDSAHPFNLVRMYIGLEDADWLIADLNQALEVI